MFFIFSKILLFLTYPITWIVSTFLIAVIGSKRKYSRKLFLVSLGLLFVFTNTVIFCEFARNWEVQGRKTSKLPNFDCAIVLTGMSAYNTDLDRLSLGKNGDRIWQTLDLYFKGKVKKILISGDSGMITDRGLHEAKQLGDIIAGWGIPRKDVIIEDKSQNTHENAQFSVQLLKRSFPELRSFLLVTSAIHMKRSLACFKKENLPCTPFSTNHFTGPNRGYFIEQYILPNSDILASWESLTKEWIGYFSYWLAGYV